MNISEKDLLLYAVTDRKWTGRKTLEEQVEEALKGGATFVQIREKHLGYEAFHLRYSSLQAWYFFCLS